MKRIKKFLYRRQFIIINILFLILIGQFMLFTIADTSQIDKKEKF